MRRFWRILAVVGLIAGLMPLLPVGVVVADDAVVGTGSSASCTEAAFNTALATAQLNGGGTITFNCGGPATISFTSSKFISTTNVVTIDGAEEITIDGSGSASGLFHVENDATLNLVGLTLQNSVKSGSGGAIFSPGGIVSIVRSTLTGNQATGGGSVGGAIFIAAGTVTIEASTFDNNSSPESGGAIFNATGNLSITASTFSENASSLASGGAIFNSQGNLSISESTFNANQSTLASGGALGQNNGSMTIEGTTISGNSAGGTGGGIALLGGSATVARSIVAGNTAPGGGANCFGSPTSLSYNLSDDATCPFGSANDIQNSANVNLGALADNGGPTMTMLPADDSDAIDAAGDCLATEDQRGESRPVGAACDIGSVEVQIPSSTFALCANWYTGQVTSPFNGECNPSSQLELVTPDDYPLTFCVSMYTGALTYSFGRPCPAGRMTHVLPDDGDLLTCVSLYTGLNRWVWNHSQCTASELPNTIYGS